MRIFLKTILLAILTAFPALAQISSPQINLSGNIGCQGFPCLNNGTLQFTSDANHTMTALESSATGGIKVTSTVSLTATRNLVLPAGNFQFIAVENATTGGQSIQVIGQSGTGVTIANGASATVWFDGTNVVQTGSSSSYTLPQATTTVLGGVKPDGTSCTTTAGVLTCAGGVSPAGTNALQASNGSGTALIVSTPNITNAALGISLGAMNTGDSISQGTGTTSTGLGNVAFTNGFSYLWQQDIGGPWLQAGISGDQSADGNWKWIYRMSNPIGNGADRIYNQELGTNDIIQYAADTNKQAIFQRIYLGNLAWQAIPRTNKTFAQSCTLAGGMSADANTIFAGLGTIATTNGASASCVVSTPKSGGSEFACYRISDGNLGTFQLLLDTVPQVDPFNGTTTWDAFGDGGALIHTTNGTNDAIVCARFPGLTIGGHTFKFVVTSATGAGNVVWPQWVGAAPLPTSLNPTVIITSPNQQNTGSAGAPYVATYQGFIQTIYNNLHTTDGLNVLYADTSNALLNDPSCGNGNATTMFANCYADNVHPNNLGHSVMHNTVKAITPASYLSGVTSSNPKSQLQNYPTVQPLSPEDWLDINPYIPVCATTQWCPGIKVFGESAQIFGMDWNANTGLTFIAPSGLTGFSFCFSGGGGLIAPLPPTLAQCNFSMVPGGAINFFQGSTAATGMTVTNAFLKTGTGFTIQSNNVLQVLGTGNSGVYPNSVATSLANFNSTEWCFNGGVWNGVLNQPGNAGPCYQFVPFSPTPSGQLATGYLTLQQPGGIGAMGVDWRGTSLVNHVAVIDATTIGGTGTATFTLGATAQVGVGATTPVCVTGYLCNSFSGTVQFTSGTGSPLAGTILNVGFPTVHIGSPTCVINTNSTTYLGANASTSSTSIGIATTAGLAASTSYTIAYICGGN